MNKLHAASVSCILLFGVAACDETKSHYVYASTATVIGVELSQSPTNASPQAKLGYNRAEIAVVPSDRRVCVITAQKTVVCETGGSPTASAKDAANVLMELRYSGIFDTGDSSGIYQRLAVGETAVQQAGATLLFAKGPDGRVSDKVAGALPGVLKLEDFTPAEIAAAEEYVDNNNKNIDRIISEIADKSNSKLVDATAWHRLIDAAVAKNNLGNSVAQNLKTYTDIQQVRDKLKAQDKWISALVAEIPPEPAGDS